MTRPFAKIPSSLYLDDRFARLGPEARLMVLTSALLARDIDSAEFHKQALQGALYPHVPAGFDALVEEVVMHGLWASVDDRPSLLRLVDYEEWNGRRGASADRDWRPGHVYVIGADSNPPYKVGLSTRPAERLVEINRTSPTQLHMVRRWEVESMRETELALHDALDAHRTHGEWFDCSLATIDMVAQAEGLVAA